MNQRICDLSYKGFEAWIWMNEWIDLMNELDEWMNEWIELMVRRVDIGVVFVFRVYYPSQTILSRSSSSSPTGKTLQQRRSSGWNRAGVRSFLWNVACLASNIFSRCIAKYTEIRARNCSDCIIFMCRNCLRLLGGNIFKLTWCAAISCYI